MKVFLTYMLFAMSIIAIPIINHNQYKYEYSKIKEDHGVVVDMNYQSSKGPPAPRSAVHTVYMLFEKSGKVRMHNVELYQTVRLDDKIVMHYQEVYKIKKSNKSNIQKLGDRRIKIIAPTGRVVRLW